MIRSALLALFLPVAAKSQGGDAVLPGCQVPLVCPALVVPSVQFPDGSVQTTAAGGGGPFLPLTGGTLSGSLAVSSDSSESVYNLVKNSNPGPTALAALDFGNDVNDMFFMGETSSGWGGFAARKGFIDMQTIDGHFTLIYSTYGVVMGKSGYLVDPTAALTLTSNPLDLPHLSLVDPVGNPGFRSDVTLGSEAEVSVRRYLAGTLADQSELSVVGAQSASVFLISTNTISGSTSGALRFIYGADISGANSYAGVSASGVNSSSSTLTLSTLSGDGYNDRLKVSESGSVLAQTGDLAVQTQGRGLVLRATDGANCYRVTVNNAGALTTSLVSCP